LPPEPSPENPDARLRGRIIHRLLELYNRRPGPEQTTSLLRQTANEFGIETNDPLLTEAWQEAHGALIDPRLQAVFDARHFDAAFDEVPIHYHRPGGAVHGVIDRLLLSAAEVVIVDYKTHPNARPDNLSLLAAPYLQQMTLYRDGVRRLWPDRPVRCLLLFTACAVLYELPVDPTSDALYLSRH